MAYVPVVINADDFGLTEGVCAGIVRAIGAFGVTSTTAMVCVPGAVQRLQHWAPRIAGKIGAHLQLTSGAPLQPPESVPSLVTKEGKFPSKRKDISGASPTEILAEWTAQLETLIRAGIEPTHLDSHHHVHGLPGVFPAFCELARRYGLPVRSLTSEMTRALQAASIQSIDRTLIDWYSGELSIASLLRVLQTGVRECPEARNLEVMCHPGLADETLGSLTRYTTEREQELAVLCHPDLQSELAKNGFELRGFRFALAQSTLPIYVSAVSAKSCG